MVANLVGFTTEACESGRIGQSRKLLCLRAPWVQIPPLPPSVLVPAGRPAGIGISATFRNSLLPTTLETGIFNPQE